MCIRKTVETICLNNQCFNLGIIGLLSGKYSIFCLIYFLVFLESKTFDHIEIRKAIRSYTSTIPKKEAAIKEHIYYLMCHKMMITIHINEILPTHTLVMSKCCLEWNAMHSVFMVGVK